MRTCSCWSRLPGISVSLWASVLGMSPICVCPLRPPFRLGSPSRGSQYLSLGEDEARPQSAPLPRIFLCSTPRGAVPGRPPGAERLAWGRLRLRGGCRPHPQRLGVSETLCLDGAPARGRRLPVSRAEPCPALFPWPRGTRRAPVKLSEASQATLWRCRRRPVIADRAVRGWPAQHRLLGRGQVDRCTARGVSRGWLCSRPRGFALCAFSGSRPSLSCACF